MEMHQVRYFLALCEQLNFTRAAETCHVTQPALTRAIKLLEGEFGGVLFHRERQNTHLTELGRMLQPHLTEIYDAALSTKRLAQSYGSARVEAACKRGNDIGAITYGSIASILKNGLDRAYAREPTPDTPPIRHGNIRGTGYYH